MVSLVDGVSRLSLITAQASSTLTLTRHIEQMTQMPTVVAQLIDDYARNTVNEQFAELRNLPEYKNKKLHSSVFHRSDGRLLPKFADYVATMQQIIVRERGVFSLSIQNILEPIPFISLPGADGTYFREPLETLGEMLSSLQFSTLEITTDTIKYWNSHEQMRVCNFIDSLTSRCNQCKAITHVDLPSPLLQNLKFCSTFASIFKEPGSIATSLVSVTIRCHFLERDDMPACSSVQLDLSWLRSQFSLPKCILPKTVTKIVITNCPLAQNQVQAWAQEHVSMHSVLKQQAVNPNRTHDYEISITSNSD